MTGPGPKGPGGRAVGLAYCCVPYAMATATIWEFPTIGGTILEIPLVRTIVFWGLNWVPPILGNYHICSDSSDISRYIAVYPGISLIPLVGDLSQ